MMLLHFSKLTPTPIWFPDAPALSRVGHLYNEHEDDGQSVKATVTLTNTKIHTIAGTKQEKLP